jgi:protein arginine kinase activator
LTLESCIMKQCDLCGKAEATLKVSQLDKDGKVTEISVCAECARQRGFTEVEKLKAGVAEIIAELKTRVAEGDTRLVCRNCGMSFAEFKRQGRLGCAECYVSFHDELVPLVRRIHGAVQHVGRTASGGRKQAQVRMNLQRIREALSGAIQAEDYEKAAALRDQLRKAETE